VAIKPKESVISFVLHATGTGVAQTLTTEGGVTHVFQTDVYPAFGGSDTAPSSMFYALGALTSCNQFTASLVANDLGIQLGEWTFDVQGDLNIAVLVGGAEGNANLDQVQMHATVQTDATPEQFATLVSETERRCPVTQLFQRSGLKFINNWTRADLPDHV
jgi:putative redox protein